MRKLPIVLTVIAATAGAGTSPAATQTQEPESPRVIQVSARGTVRQAPDRAGVQFAVETTAETAAAATRQNAATMDRVLAALRQIGIPDALVRTTRIELRPRYDQRRPQEAPPPIVGYQAVNQVAVRVEDIGLVGRVIDAAVAAGANRVTAVTFELADPDTAYREALRAAIARAGSEARVMAEALGEELGPPLRVTTGAMQLPPPEVRLEAARAEAMMAAPTPVQPGELDVHAHVSITYRLGQ